MRFKRVRNESGNLLCATKAQLKKYYRYLVKSLALPALSGIDIALALVLGNLGVHAKRPLPRHLSVRSVVDIFGSDDGIGGRAVLDPRNHGKQRVVLFVPETRYAVDIVAQHGCLVATSEVPWCAICGRVSGAVTHTGDEEEAEELIHVDALRGERAVDVVVVPGGRACWDQPVRQAVVRQDLAAFGVVCREVVADGGVARVDFISEALDVLVEVVERPVAAETEEVLNVVSSERVGRIAVEQEPGLLAAEVQVREEEGLVLADGIGVELVERADLRRGQAVGGFVASAKKLFCSEVAADGVRDDVIDESVLRIALLDHFLADRREKRRRDVVICRLGEIVERHPCGPYLEVRGPPRRRSSKNTIKVLGVLLGLLKSLSSAC